MRLLILSSWSRIYNSVWLLLFWAKDKKNLTALDILIVWFLFESILRLKILELMYLSNNWFLQRYDWLSDELPYESWVRVLRHDYYILNIWMDDWSILESIWTKKLAISYRTFTEDSSESDRVCYDLKKSNPYVEFWLIN